MTDIERNKQTVVEFYELAFNAKQPEQAVEKYLGPQYIQHNPQAPERCRFVHRLRHRVCRAVPRAKHRDQACGRRGAIVVTHGLIKTSAEDPRHSGRRLLPA